MLHPGMTDQSGNAVKIEIKQPQTYMGGWVLEILAEGKWTVVAFDRSSYKAFLEELVRNI